LFRPRRLLAWPPGLGSGRPAVHHGR